MTSLPRPATGPAAAESEVDRQPPLQPLRDAVDSHPLWYHTIELAPELATPGWFDHRRIADRLPWPDLSGRRCLDVGSNDGFWAFEMERRGASEVIGIDVDPDAWEWPSGKPDGTEWHALVASHSSVSGFEIAKRALGSSVKRLNLSVFDLDPAEVGRFDFVFCGSLLLHLKEPIAALERMRGVCEGQLLVSEHIELLLTLIHPKRPLLQLKATQEGQWWAPNLPGLRKQVYVAGFELERETRPFCVPFGAGGKTRPTLPRGPRYQLGSLLKRLVTGGTGDPHAAVLAHPRQV